MALQIHDRHCSRIIPKNRMLEECNQIPLRGNPRVTHPASAGLEEHFADRELKTEALTHVSNCGDAAAVRTPVGILDILENGPRCRTGRRAGKRARLHIRCYKSPIANQQQLA